MQTLVNDQDLRDLFDLMFLAVNGVTSYDDIEDWQDAYENYVQWFFYNPVGRLAHDKWYAQQNLLANQKARI